MGTGSVIGNVSAALVDGSSPPAAAQQLPPHFGQHVADFVE
jgi:hypothetical protein